MKPNYFDYDDTDRRVLIYDDCLDGLKDIEWPEPFASGLIEVSFSDDVNSIIFDMFDVMGLSDSDTANCPKLKAKLVWENPEENKISEFIGFNSDFT